jgi:hypothetical protein
MEPPYPWRTADRSSSYYWSCRNCTESKYSTIEAYQQEAVDHARATGHAVAAVARDTTVIEGMKI